MTTTQALRKSGAGQPDVRRPGQRAKRARRSLVGLAYASPLAVFVIVLFVLPLLTVGQMSASNWSLLGGNQGINFPQNFNDLGQEPLLWPSVLFTLKYTAIVTVILLALGLGIALLVQESTRWTTFLRTAVLVPSSLGLASASLLFWGLYSPTIGPLSPVLEFFGLTKSAVAFLGTPDSALWSTVFLVVWRFTGFYVLILMVGLQSIPTDVYEAARIDGAGRWKTFTGVTLPLLRPSLALSLILCVTGSLLAFDQFYILTNGGPDNSTVTVVQVIFHEAFQRFNLGTAGALSIVVLIALVVINIVQIRGLRAKD